MRRQPEGKSKVGGMRVTEGSRARYQSRTRVAAEEAKGEEKGPRCASNSCKTLELRQGMSAHAMDEGSAGRGRTLVELGDEEIDIKVGEAQSDALLAVALPLQQLKAAQREGGGHGQPIGKGDGGRRREDEPRASSPTTYRRRSWCGPVA